MKLIYLANIGLSSRWAHEIQIMKMCEAFALSGTEVELVVPKRARNTKEDFHGFYGVKNNFKITQLFCLDLNPDSVGRFNFWVRLASFLAAAKIYLTGKNYDILYTREQLAGLFFGNFILEIHSLPERIKNFHKRAWQKAKLLVVLTSFIKNELANFGVDAKKVLIASDAVNLAEFDLDISKEEARKRLGLPQDKRSIMYNGNFFIPEWKGADILMEAAKYVGPDYVFVLVGGNKAEIERAKKEFPAQNIILIERQRHSQMPYYLKAADVLVLPNKKGDANSEKYTSPMKLFEYMASGRPIVASDLPSVREILNEENAVFVEANSPKSLAAGIEKIISNSALAEDISRQAFQNVQNYSWNQRVKSILNFVQDGAENPR